jgi:hypothetical protein
MIPSTAAGCTVVSPPLDSISEWNRLRFIVIREPVSVDRLVRSKIAEPGRHRLRSRGLHGAIRRIQQLVRFVVRQKERHPKRFD